MPSLTRIAAKLAVLGLDLPDSAQGLADVTNAALHAGAAVEANTFLADLERMTISAKDVPKRLQAAAQAIVVRKAREELMGDVRSRLDVAALNWATTHERDLVEVVRPTFDSAAEQLTTAIGDLHGLTTAEEAVNADVGDAWKARHQAVTTLGKVFELRKDWCVLARSELPMSSAAWWLASVDTTDDFDRAGALLDRSHFRVADLVAGGFDLRMNLTIEALALIANAAAGSEEQRQAAQAADPAVAVHNQRVKNQVRALAPSAQ